MRNDPSATAVYTSKLKEIERKTNQIMTLRQINVE